MSVCDIICQSRRLLRFGKISFFAEKSSHKDKLVQRPRSGDLFNCPMDKEDLQDMHGIPFKACRINQVSEEVRGAYPTAGQRITERRRGLSNKMKTVAGSASDAV
jgi:hypothetical protein